MIKKLFAALLIFAVPTFGQTSNCTELDTTNPYNGLGAPSPPWTAPSCEIGVADYMTCLTMYRRLVVEARKKPSAEWDIAAATYLLGLSQMDAAYGTCIATAGNDPFEQFRCRQDYDVLHCSLNDEFLLEQGNIEERFQDRLYLCESVFYFCIDNACLNHQHNGNANFVPRQKDHTPFKETLISFDYAPTYPPCVLKMQS